MINAPTMAEVAEARRGQPLPKGKTRLEEKIEQRPLTKVDEKHFKAEVWKRDGKLCRCCHRKVVVTLKLQASQAHCHHVTGRQHKPTRTDVRNGLQLCATCHQKVEHNELQIVSTQTFTLGNREYADMTDFNAVTFKELQ